MKVTLKRVTNWMCNRREWEMDIVEALAYIDKLGYKSYSAHNGPKYRIVYFSKPNTLTTYEMWFARDAK